MIRTFAIAILSVFIAGASLFLWLPRTTLSEVSSEKEIVAGMEKCHESKSKASCLKGLAAELVDRFSIPEILTVFKEHEAEAAFFGACHEEAHYLGREAYKKIGSVAKVYAQGSEICLGGVYHGALEGYFIEKKLLLGKDNMAEIKTAVASVCDEVEAETPRSFTQCHHGLGHALMFAVEDSLPDALSLCDALPKQSYRDGCYTGAFMQNVVNRNSTDHPNSMLRDDEPLYPCPVLGIVYQPICYTYAVLEHYQGNVEKGIELCGMIPEKYSEECFRTFGRNAVMYTDQPATIIGNCSKISKQIYRKACLLSAAGELLVRYGLESKLSIELCSLLDTLNQAECFAELGRRARTLVVDYKKVAEFCFSIKNEKYREACVADSI